MERLKTNKTISKQNICEALSKKIERLEGLFKNKVLSADKFNRTQQELSEAKSQRRKHQCQ